MQIATGRANGTTLDQTSFDLNSGLPESEHTSESFFSSKLTDASNYSGDHITLPPIYLILARQFLFAAHWPIFASSTPLLTPPLHRRYFGVHTKWDSISMALYLYPRRLHFHSQRIPQNIAVIILDPRAERKISAFQLMDTRCSTKKHLRSLNHFIRASTNPPTNQHGCFTIPILDVGSY